jgi:hypothetical protein
MAQLTGQALGPDAGIADLVAALTAAAGGGDSFILTGRDVFVANNASGGAITITFTAVADNFGVTNAVHNLTLVVNAGKIGVWGPGTLARFRDANGLLQVTYSGVTSLTVGVLRVGTAA